MCIRDRYKEGSEAYDELTEFVEHPKQTEPETKPSQNPSLPKQKV